MAYSNDDLVKELIDLGYLKSQPIIEAFLAIDRKNFVPSSLVDFAYHNEPLPIGSEQTISQPLVVAFMLELLDPRPNEKILEIGAGSGWQTALIAYLVDKTPQNADLSIENVSNQSSSIEKKDNIESNQNFGNKKSAKIFALERIPQLKEMAQRNISYYGFIEKGVVELINADGSKGYQEAAPFDKIICSASAQKIPEPWKEQLAIGGRIVTPVKDSIVVLDKASKNDFKEKIFYGFSFVPLIED